MGTGHLMRCLTLAECLRNRGSQIRFVCRAHPGHLNELVRDRGLPVAELRAPEPSMRPDSDEDYAQWLGVSQEEDAEQSHEALGDERPDWLVVDHYGLDAPWERRMRADASKIMVIDDLANRFHDCDALLNQNFSDRGPDRYAGRVPDRCRMMLGPHFALLRPEFLECRAMTRRADGRVRRIFIFFGGSDPRDVTGRALDALSDQDFAEIELDIVVGANYAYRRALDEKAWKRPRTNVHGPVAQLARLMQSADLAIGGGGGTTWERMCLGIPSLVVNIAENQVPACEALSASGLIRYLGAESRVTVADIRDALHSCIASPADLAQLALGGQRTVDGLGAERVAEYLAGGNA